MTSIYGPTPPMMMAQMKLGNNSKTILPPWMIPPPDFFMKKMNQYKEQ